MREMHAFALQGSVRGDRIKQGLFICTYYYFGILERRKKKMNRKPNIALVGATGMVGRTFI
ncbi:MAG: hypothetical protein FWF33_00915, partial [Clostridiales bacterium]|nr:hypothetical protein [Clostridiales bacterium]